MHLISSSEPEEVTEGVSAWDRHDLIHFEPLWLWRDNECTVGEPQRPQGDQSVIELWVRNEGTREGGGGDIRKVLVKAMVSMGYTPDNNRI